MSKQITALATDLASFNNLADDDVLRDLHAALTGSGEVMKKYGVIVSEAAVKQELLNQGLDPKNATEQQKVMARLAIIMRGTTAAQGDAARSAGSFCKSSQGSEGSRFGCSGRNRNGAAADSNSVGFESCRSGDVVRTMGFEKPRVDSDGRKAGRVDRGDRRGCGYSRRDCFRDLQLRSLQLQYCLG